MLICYLQIFVFLNQSGIPLVPKGLVPYQAQHIVEPDLDPKCLHFRLSAGDKSLH